MREGLIARREQWKLISLRYEWRHKFLAYCILKGRKLENIERTVREGNEANQTLINKYIKEFTGE